MLKQEYLWLRNIDVSNAHHEQLLNYDLSIFEGEIICITSSTFSKRKLVSNLILGYLKPENGSIFLNEKLCKNYNAQFAFSHGISSSESTGSLVKTMKIEHNLFALRERNNPLSIFNEKAAQIQTQKILNSLGLFDYKNKLIQDLSVYEQQIVCLAKSVINNAKIIVVNDTSMNSYEEKMQLIKNIKTYSKQGVSFIIICDENDESIYHANRIQYISDSNQIFEFEEVKQFLVFLDDQNSSLMNKNISQRNSSLDFLVPNSMDAFRYDDAILDMWLSKRQAYEITGNIDRYFIPNFSIKENICLGIYSKLTTWSILNENLIDFTFLEAKRFANITNSSISIDKLTHLQKLLLLIYRVSLQNHKFIILNDIFNEMDDYEWSHLIRTLEDLVEKRTVIYFKNCNSHYFRIKSSNFYQLDRKKAIMIKKDTF